MAYGESYGQVTDDVMNVLVSQYRSVEFQVTAKPPQRRRIDIGRRL